MVYVFAGCVYVGDVRRGCGNPKFDYSTTVWLDEALRDAENASTESTPTDLQKSGRRVEPSGDNAGLAATVPDLPQTETSEQQHGQQHDGASTGLPQQPANNSRATVALQALARRAAAATEDSSSELGKPRAAAEVPLQSVNGGVDEADEADGQTPLWMSKSDKLRGWIDSQDKSVVAPESTTGVDLEEVQGRHARTSTLTDDDPQGDTQSEQNTPAVGSPASHNHEYASSGSSPEPMTVGSRTAPKRRTRPVRRDPTSLTHSPGEIDETSRQGGKRAEGGECDEGAAGGAADINRVTALGGGAESSVLTRGQPLPDAIGGRLADGENASSNEALIRQSLDSLEVFRRNNLSRLESNISPRGAGEGMVILGSVHGEHGITTSTADIVDVDAATSSAGYGSGEGKLSDGASARRNRWQEKRDDVDHMMGMLHNLSSESPQSPQSPPSPPGHLSEEDTQVSVAPAHSGNGSANADVFMIPALPSGSRLDIIIHSTWGDPHYVGLVGIDLFDHNGRRVTMACPSLQITADPPDINVLEGYQDDPRRVQNLLDGANDTRDDMHVWLAPFTPGSKNGNRISLEFDDVTTLSMIRVWNYNKSRAHSYRGARLVRFLMDDRLIFDGEIRKASGLHADQDSQCEVILLTDDHRILRSIEREDDLFRTSVAVAAGHGEPGIAGDQLALALSETMAEEIRAQRPMTPGGEGGNTSAAMLPRRRTVEAPALTYDQARVIYGKAGTAAGQAGHAMSSELPGAGATSHDARPRTAAVQAGVVSQRRSLDSVDTTRSSFQCSSSIVAREGERKQQSSVLEIMAGEFHDVLDETSIPHIRSITLELLDTWGDPHYMGLTGVAVSAGADQTALSLELGNLEASPRDLNVFGYEGDPRTLDKLVDDDNQTTDEHHMWLIPFDPHGRHTVTIDLGRLVPVTALHIWNYNKNVDDTSRGVRHLRVLASGCPKGTSSVSSSVSSLTDEQWIVEAPGGGQCHMLRKAPGCGTFDFVQSIPIAPQLRERAENVLRMHTPQAVVGGGHGGGGGGPTNSAPWAKQGRTFPGQDYETPLLPSGHIFRLMVYSSWGDRYYVGLDQVEFYDSEGQRISLSPRQIFAHPASINALPSVAESSQQGFSQDNTAAADVRLPENVVDGTYGDCSGTHSWLAPLATTYNVAQDAYGGVCANTLYVVFDFCVTISMVKVRKQLVTRSLIPVVTSPHSAPPPPPQRR